MGQNEGNYAKIKEILLQPSSIWGEVLAKFIRRGIRVSTYFQGLFVR